MSEQKDKSREKIRDYIKGAIQYPLADFEQLISMVILHFDIPDVEAKKLVWEAILALISGIEELKKQIGIKRDKAFYESGLGDSEHREGMVAQVRAYTVVLNLIREMVE